jgi:hypothetical protein
MGNKVRQVGQKTRQLLHIIVRTAKVVMWTIVAAIIFIFASNLLFFPTVRNLPARALAAASPSCANAQSAQGWDVLSKANVNSPQTEKSIEWSAVDIDKQWRAKLACSIQHHTVPGYNGTLPDGTKVESLSYDLAFVEFQEDGKPYVLREECSGGEGCVDERGIRLRKQVVEKKNIRTQVVEKINVSQIGPVLKKLADNNKNGIANYVVVFVHGWRHDASIGDGNVGDFHLYAAHAARFLAERAASKSDLEKTRVTAIYIGWRGARTDENWLKRNVPWFGETIGTFSAVLTLFDRKPVSESVAPAALAALRTIENTLSIDQYTGPLPAKNPNKMIVIGHSLGGNMLITALQDPLIKKIEAFDTKHIELRIASHVDSHDPQLIKPRDAERIQSHLAKHYMLPVLGDLVVLINPAAEASKWTSIQRALWSKLALVNGERRSIEEYDEGHRYFRDDQRPIIVSATAARNWPPGGRQQIDCLVDNLETTVNDRVQKIVKYDWATHDLFPAFKGDLRPLADRIAQWGTQSDPNDECAPREYSWWDHLRHPIRAVATWLSGIVRVLPFMVTDPEQTQTIGNLDPPRSPTKNLSEYGVSMRPFGTTHELRSGQQFDSRKRSVEASDDGRHREIPLEYREVVSPDAACPAARNWLSRVRAKKKEKEIYAIGWDTLDLRASTIQGEGFPALRFVHGFDKGGMAPTTRANDPFWNVRAFDTALSEHNGYLLSSFICAINQLVLDDITTIGPP